MLSFWSIASLSHSRSASWELACFNDFTLTKSVSREQLDSEPLDFGSWVHGRSDPSYELSRFDIADTT